MSFCKIIVFLELQQSHNTTLMKKILLIAAAMLLATIIELVIMNRAHNEYASRPVPFFDGKEEAA